jgi:hypothetical protein
VRNQERAEDAVSFGQHFLQRFLNVLLLVGQGDYAHNGALPSVLEIQFGNGHIEMLPQAIFQAAEHLPLILQRLGIGEMQFQCEKPNGHGPTSGRKA